MPKPSSPASEKLRNALATKDINELREALKAGASVEDTEGRIADAPSRMRVPLEFVISKQYPKVFVDVLLDAGAITEEVRSNGRLQKPSLLVRAIQAGNGIAVEAILDRRSPFEVVPSEWRSCIESRKPHLWLNRLLDHGSVPDRGTAGTLLGKMVGNGQKRAIDVLLARVDLPNHWAAHEDVIEGAIKNPATFRYLLQEGLKRNPAMLQDLHVLGEGVLSMVIKKYKDRSDLPLRAILNIPEISDEIQMQWDGRSVMKLLLGSSQTRKFYPAAVAAGVPFDPILPDEEKEEYLTRLAPALMHDIKRNTPKGFADTWEAWLDQLWATAQQQHMMSTTPASASKPSRRF